MPLVDWHRIKGLGSYMKSSKPVFFRRIASSSASARIIHIPKANVYRFGDSNASKPLFRDLEWTVNEGESWAVVGSGSGSKTALFQMLLGHLRISPPPPPPDGLFPFLSHLDLDPTKCVSIVSFGNRRRASEGAFYDYTARYGAVREEDRITLRQSMFPEADQVDDTQKKRFDELIDKVGLLSFLDLPLVALSNGQTRRARIVKAILSRPELLLLDEPLTGLDVTNRPTLLSLLHSLHSTCSPRIIMGLRTQDEIPDWISHVAFVKEDRVIAGPKESYVASDLGHKTEVLHPPIVKKAAETGKILVDMRNVRVAYHEREVLKSIHWKIRAGERWHLRGANGSGKTTLLSVLTGDHPQSYTQQLPKSELTLFDRPRSRIPTPHLSSLIGVLSPELFDAFPRRAGMSVWDAIATGFDGGFVPKGKHGVGVGVMNAVNDDERNWRVERVWEVLHELGPTTWVKDMNVSIEEFKNRAFVDLSVSEQRMVLLMRALVGRPPLVLLDEVWSGMDEAMVKVARKYLREGGIGDDQAVVVITHWEEEVPWDVEDGVRRFELKDGVGSVTA